MGAGGRGVKPIHGGQKMPVNELIYCMPAISLQACKFTKNELLHTYFQGFQLEFKLLFIVLFLEISSWKVVSRFH